MQAEPAAAFLDYGFEAPPAVRVTTTADSPDSNAGPELFRTRAVAIPTNRFRDSWANLVKAMPRPDRLRNTPENFSVSASNMQNRVRPRICRGKIARA